MFTIFIRGHLLTKKFFTFLVGSTFFSNKHRLSAYEYKDSYHTFSKKQNEEHEDNREKSQSLKESYSFTPIFRGKLFKNADYKYCIKFILQNMGTSINYILGYLTIFRKLNIIQCEIPKMRKPYLGCSIRANEDNIPGMKVVMIKSDSPAEKAGLKVKDIIVEIDGKPVRNIHEYNAAIGLEANTKKLKVFRNENYFIVEVEFTFSD